MKGNSLVHKILTVLNGKVLCKILLKMLIIENVASSGNCRTDGSQRVSGQSGGERRNPFSL
jgi:hypothetical protein